MKKLGSTIPIAIIIVIIIGGYLCVKGSTFQGIQDIDQISSGSKFIKLNVFSCSIVYHTEYP